MGESGGDFQQQGEEGGASTGKKKKKAKALLMQLGVPFYYIGRSRVQANATRKVGV